MKAKKSIYRIVPAKLENSDACWLLKDGSVIIGTFISKKLAEKHKTQLERKMSETFTLGTT